MIKEIFTTENYLYLKALRGIAIIISTNEDLVSIIKRKAVDDNLSAEFLSQKLDNMLVDLEK